MNPTQLRTDDIRVDLTLPGCTEPMAVHPKGRWVTWEDYERLLAYAVDLEKQLSQAKLGVFVDTTSKPTGDVSGDVQKQIDILLSVFPKPPNE